ncbi:MAG: autoinducer binding domain-containing protein [Alphaproteobacteria bacterium]|nr:autoinducer binding domain-containing protein [Alphaproteobacteria bacterium]
MKFEDLYELIRPIAECASHGEILALTSMFPQSSTSSSTVLSSAKLKTSSKITLLSITIIPRNGRRFIAPDPISRRIRQTALTFSKPSLLWSEVSDTEVFRAAKEFGIGDGVTCTVRGSHHICSVSFAVRKKDVCPEMMVGAQFIIPYLCNSVICIAETELATAPILSEREKECLKWVSEGKTSWETSVIMSISERTVLFHLSNIQSKLQTTSRAHSVAKAAILGLLNADLFSGDPSGLK